jgi:hypothetical protein
MIKSLFTIRAGFGKVEISFWHREMDKERSKRREKYKDGKIKPLYLILIVLVLLRGHVAIFASSFFERFNKSKDINLIPYLRDDLLPHLPLNNVIWF